MIKIKTFNKNNAHINSYLLVNNGKAICIDPGFNGTEIYHFLNSHKVTLTKIILTHAHFDHIRDIKYLSDFFSFNLYLHENDIEILKNNKYNYANAFNEKFVLPNDITIVYLKDEDTIKFENQNLTIISTPGHTAGSICIKYQNHVFTGDTLFYDSIGRTDLYSGSNSQIFASLKKILKKISNNSMIYPGHGKTGYLQDIKDNNPFLAEQRY